MIAPISRIFALVEATETEIHATNHLETFAKLAHLICGDRKGRMKGINGWMATFYMPCQGYFNSAAEFLEPLLVHSGPDLDDMLKNLLDSEMVNCITAQ